jgi:hypothetical protein
LIKPLFSREAKVIAAKDILCKKALSLQSPDRVVMLKNTLYVLRFISCPAEDKDRRLLNRYAAFLTQMGYTSVEKLIVCTDGEEVERW